MKNLQKNDTKGITLIALAITIVILIILAGVAINLSFGENGLFNRAKYAKQEYEIAQEKEKLDTKIAEVQIEKEGKATINDVVEALKNETGVTYYIAGNKIAAVTTIGVISDAPKELYVVCNDKYQFKVEENLNTEFISIVDVEKIGEVVPPATEDTEVGTKVETPSNWKTETPDYVEVESGKIITKSSEVASVYAVSVGGKDVVPIPKGFYYVGGNLQTGVVISDKEKDKNKYAGYEDDGVTIKDVGVDLEGNQFVWIPCTVENYKKKDFGGTTYANAGWDNKTDNIEKTQIKKYGGFYIGRYEAGLGEAGISNPMQAVSATTNSTYNWKGQSDIYTIVKVDSTAKPTSKANEIPWFHADYSTAVEMSDRMYSSSNCVTSGLVTGTMWDVMLQYIANKSEYTSSGTWGNYSNSSINLDRGYYTNVNTSGATDGFKEVKSGQKSETRITNYPYVLLSTGTSDEAKRKNIYDVAGNLWEWTTEASYIANTTYSATNFDLNSHILRGGSFNNVSNSRPACYRASDATSSTNIRYGFRVALYII